MDVNHSIQITTRELLGLKFRSALAAESDITVSSEFGLKLPLGSLTLRSTDIHRQLSGESRENTATCAQ
jgi:hypothetical protein